MSHELGTISEWWDPLSRTHSLTCPATFCLFLSRTSHRTLLDPSVSLASLHCDIYSESVSWWWIYASVQDIHRSSVIYPSLWFVWWFSHGWIEFGAPRDQTPFSLHQGHITTWPAAFDSSPVPCLRWIFQVTCYDVILSFCIDSS